MHANTRHVSQTATSLGLDIELKAFPEGTKTAVQAAEAIGVVVGQIVKSLIFAVGDKSDQVSGELSFIELQVAGHECHHDLAADLI
jgi:hypothetical protein